MANAGGTNAVSAVLGKFSESSLRETVGKLAGFKSRALGQPGNVEAALYLHDRFRMLERRGVSHARLSPVCEETG